MRQARIKRLAAKWRKYAEVFVKERTAYIDGFGNRKKRRKIEVLFNAIDNFSVMLR
jgi:hypothetical protein